MILKNTKKFASHTHIRRKYYFQQQTMVESGTEKFPVQMRRSGKGNPQIILT